MSSSKLQFCLELCQFAQVLLNTKLQDGRCISLLVLARGSNYNSLMIELCITRCTQPKRKLLCLESRCYNYPYHNLKSITLPRLVCHKHHHVHSKSLPYDRVSLMYTELPLSTFPESHYHQGYVLMAP
jgi:hypothetical protein